MRPVIAVLNPRAIPECIRALEDLSVPKVWISSYTEHQIATTAWPLVMEGARERGYTHMLVVSDDAIVNARAVDALIGLLADGHPVVTGYSNLDGVDPRVNLSLTPIKPAPAEDALDLPHWTTLLRQPTVFRTYFGGMCLTGTSLDLWDQYPFEVFGGPPGWSSDHALCVRLQRDGVPIAAHKEAFAYHVKETWNRLDAAPEKRLLIGERPAEVRFDEAAP